VSRTRTHRPTPLRRASGTATLEAVAQALTAPVSGRSAESPEESPALPGRPPVGVEPGLLQLKSPPARLHPRLVPRERLLRRLLDARDVPVALMVAPAGYGKSTLLSQWSVRDDRAFAWVTLDPSDNDPRNLLSAIALALHAVEPVGWEVFEALASDRRDGSTVALQRLARSLGRRELSAVLVLDNLDLLRTPESRRVVAAICNVAGRGLQLALASRADAALPVGRLRAHGSSVELRTPDLAMTRSEASMLLQLAAVDLAPEKVLTLARRTEGWPAGLYLAALALREQCGDRPDPEEFAGDDRFVSEYIREELLAGLAPAELEFLTRTSILDRLSASVCDAILGRRDSAGMLARLARSNVLLVPLDRRDSCYRYHGLFVEALRAELRRREPGQDVELHRRASAWFAATGDTDQAIEHSLDAHDLHRAAGLLWSTALPHATSGRARTVLSSLNRFTDRELADRPLLALVAAGAALLGGNLYEAERWTWLASSAASDANIEHAGLALMEAGVGRGGMAEIDAGAARAHALLDDASPWRSLCALLRGVALHLKGDPNEARRHLQEGAHRAAASAPLIQALCLAQLALITADEGDLERATALIERAVAQVRRAGLELCPIVALPFAASADLRSRRGELEEARTELRQALGLLRRVTDPSPWYEAECRILMARAVLRLGGLAAAAEHLDEAGRALRRTPDAHVLGGWLGDALADVDRALAATPRAEWSLTSAEIRVLRYLPSHLSFREIAERLYVSPNTVKTHARGIYRKLGVSSRAHAVDRARGAGLVDAQGGA
jgi:LuxR family transcriptional regulator, maltose regulon positive regulatory protein